MEVVAKLPAPYRLMIIGGGSAADEAYRDQLATLATRLGCRDRVELTNMPQAEIRAVIDRGDRLPRKSTYFWPKPLTGMVIRPLN